VSAALAACSGALRAPTLSWARGSDSLRAPLSREDLACIKRAVHAPTCVRAIAEWRIPGRFPPVGYCDVTVLFVSPVPSSTALSTSTTVV
jgi:hypothetical protein